MARRVPRDAEGINVPEEVVLDALCRQLPDAAVVLPGLRFTDGGVDREADAVVVWPGVGVAVVEVKGGTVEYAGGAWHQGTSSGRRKIDPVEQALKAKYALRDYLRDDPRWPWRDPHVAHHVVVPSTQLPDGFQAPGCPREAISDHDDLDGLGDRLRAQLQGTDRGVLVDEASARQMVGALAGPSRPQADQVRVLAGEVAEREQHVEVMTRRQSAVLDMMRDNRRLLVLGSAGTGKTWLAVEQARRLTAEGARVALLCYSRGLAQWLRRRFAEGHEPAAPAFVGTFHALGHQWGARIREGAGQDFWDVELPAEMVRLAQYLGDDERFDAVVVDEGQDFAPDWWGPLEAALSRRGDGRLVVFADEGQQVFSRGAPLDASFARATLAENLRNSVPIATAFAPLGRHPSTPAGPAGPEVRWVECASGDAVSRADAEVERLLEVEGWSAEHVMLLTTRGRHPEQVERTVHLGREGYWDTFWDDRDVFYGHVYGVKGLERPAVVLALNGYREAERAREMRYVGMSRARDLLVVCGDGESLSTS